MSRLFVVATPIGNLEDVTLRALRVLAAVSLIAAEDTRTARVLLRRYDIRRPLVSYNEHNRGRRIPEILERLAAGDVALACDAGTPAISDPGVEHVDAARAAGHAVVAVPGPSAAVAALSIAGLRTRSYRFEGFLPRGAGALRRLLEAAASDAAALVAFESPRRLRATLGVVAEALPERRIAVCRELTKLHEEAFVGTAAEGLARFEAPKGEVVLIIEGAAAARPGDALDEDALREELAAMRAAGLTRAQAAALLSRRFRLSRRRLYELWLERG